MIQKRYAVTILVYKHNKILSVKTAHPDLGVLFLFATIYWKLHKNLEKF